MTYTYDEFGNPNSTSTPRYGWLGGKARAQTGIGNLTLMGQRLYDAASGRFLQTDPIPGGSANPYDYADQDPVNNFDLGGTSVAPGQPGKNGCYATEGNCHSTSAYGFRPFVHFVERHQKAIMEVNLAVIGAGLSVAFCGFGGELVCVLAVGAAYTEATGIAQQKSEHPKQSMGQDALYGLGNVDRGAGESFAQSWIPAWFRAAFGWVR